MVDKKVIGSIAVRWATAMVTIFFLWAMYPRLVYTLYGETIRPTWSKNLIGSSKSELVRKLGIPSEDVTAKDMANWIDRHWWGDQILTVVIKSCCGEESKAEHIAVIVLVARPIGSHVRYTFHPPM